MLKALCVVMLAGLLCSGCGSDEPVPTVLAKDGSAVAQVKPSGGGKVVTKDGERVGGRYDNVGSPVLAPGGKGITFPAQVGNKWVAVRDGKIKGGK